MTFPLLVLEDKNSNCVSIMLTVPLKTYLSLVEGAYSEQGGLAGQRAPIRTKTGLKIRRRLVEDLTRGAVIPPIVVGAVAKPIEINRFKKMNTSQELVDALIHKKIDVSIIDGMQRTTAFIEANAEKKIEPLIRVELWLARKVDSLIYRMLVLNTGQVPWDLKRQLETLYKPIVAKITHEVANIRVIGLDDNTRRSQAGEYRSTKIIELFLAFTSRSVDVDIRERVAEEFATIDVTEATADEEFFPLFIETIKLMASVDAQFDRVERGYAAVEGARVKNGRDIFTSVPASIGFVVAAAEKLLGEPGFDYDLDSAKKEMDKIKKNINLLIKHIGKLKEEELIEFLDLDTLNQMLSARSSRIGEYERNLYKRAFLLLMNKAPQLISQGSLAPCWKAR
ncbi:hypothetical protein SOM61_04455 [Massilia sp. CFBP9012]|uniref:hypothetical protein n=1 Tax=Massilia sp. CFBP9012 TaxID=3096531 RepID=UPI002A6AFC9B|nr:hypothetical protein [Massilia sp. CFBP9012]MDY0974206.1 hypothetical protein [Massilia sp. CFBP9012]